MFLLSGAISLAAIAGFVYGIFRVMPEDVRRQKITTIRVIGGIFLAINILYFTNIIPPIPLSLKDAGVYHLVLRSGGEGYIVYAEEKTWRDFLRLREEFHQAPGEPVYFFSAVFAPTDLKTQIFHRWEYYDELKGGWTETDRLPFSILGGRDGGYRGYSTKRNAAPGRWRVDVITERGQLLGRDTFTIIEVAIPPALEAGTR